MSPTEAQIRARKKYREKQEYLQARVRVVRTLYMRDILPYYNTLFVGCKVFFTKKEHFVIGKISNRLFYAAWRGFLFFGIKRTERIVGRFCACEQIGQLIL